MEAAYWVTVISSRLQLEHLVYSQSQTPDYFEVMEQKFKSMVENQSDSDLAIGKLDFQAVREVDIERIERDLFALQEFGFGAFPYFSVDISQDDETLKADFQQLVEKLRLREQVFAKRRKISAGDIARWNSHSVLPCKDLRLWSVVTKQKLTQGELASLLEIKGNDPVESIRKTTLKHVEEVFTEATLARVRNIAASEAKD